MPQIFILYGFKSIALTFRNFRSVVKKISEIS